MKRIHSYEVYPKNLMAQNVVYQNMSNHYRRLYNAKSQVDSSPPWSCKISKTSTSTPHGRTKQDYWESKYNLAGVYKEKQQKQPYHQECCAANKDDSAKIAKESIQINKQKAKAVGQENLPMFQPKILNIGVQSKLQSLQVYHPPRRRPKSRLVENKKQEPKFEKDKEVWVQPTDTMDNDIAVESKPSSSDSAYTEEGEVGWSGGESRGTTPVQMSTPPRPVVDWSSSHKTCNKSDDLLYIKFLRDITDDVLRKGVFTNRALKNIFEQHISANKYRLNVKRMQEEVDKLCVQLGIPKEDYLNDTDYGLGSIRDWKDSYDDMSYSGSNTSIGDSELIQALEQLDISPDFREDIALSLGLSKSKEYTQNTHEHRTLVSKNINFSTSVERDLIDTSTLTVDNHKSNDQLQLQFPVSGNSATDFDEDLRKPSISKTSVTLGVICQN